MPVERLAMTSADNMHMAVTVMLYFNVNEFSPFVGSRKIITEFRNYSNQTNLFCNYKCSYI